MYNRKVLIITFFAIFAMVISSCKNQSDPNNEVNKTTDGYIINESETAGDVKSKPVAAADENSELKSVANDNKETESGIDEDKISVSIFGDQTLIIDKSRFNGTGQLNNRWSLNEIDVILNSIQGEWEIERYIGFVVSSIYYPDLFDHSDNIAEDVRNNLIEDYNKKVESAKKNIPNISFSVKRHNTLDTDSKYIIVNDDYQSTISIILSMDRIDEYYPVFVDQTTLSIDFVVEYPVIYIKFFIEYKDDLEARYEPATLVLTKDNKFYILVDGAFYSVVSKWHYYVN